MSKVAIPIISCSCDEQKLKKLFHLEHSHIRNDDDFDDDDDAMGHGVCQIMMFVDGGGWGSGKTQNKMTSFMNSAINNFVPRNQFPLRTWCQYHCCVASSEPARPP